MKYMTEDGCELETGDQAYDYYSMKPGKIGEDARAFEGGWFTFEHTDGTTELLNGQRICTMGYAIRRGFPGAVAVPKEARDS